MLFSAKLVLEYPAICPKWIYGNKNVGSSEAATIYFIERAISMFSQTPIPYIVLKLPL